MVKKAEFGSNVSGRRWIASIMIAGVSRQAGGTPISLHPNKRVSGSTINEGQDGADSQTRDYNDSGCKAEVCVSDPEANDELGKSKPRLHRAARRPWGKKRGNGGKRKRPLASGLRPAPRPT